MGRRAGEREIERGMNLMNRVIADRRSVHRKTMDRRTDRRTWQPHQLRDAGSPDPAFLRQAQGDYSPIRDIGNRAKGYPAHQAERCLNESSVGHTHPAPLALCVGKGRQLLFHPALKIVECLPTWRRSLRKVRHPRGGKSRISLLDFAPGKSFPGSKIDLAQTGTNLNRQSEL